MWYYLFLFDSTDCTVFCIHLVLYQVLAKAIEIIVLIKRAKVRSY